MKLFPSTHNLPFQSFWAGWLFWLACLALWPIAAFSQEPAHYNFTLTNRSDVRITRVVLAPYGRIQIHTDAALTPGEKIVISRPECRKMRMEITHSKGRFSFPFTDFTNEKNTALSLVVRDDTVPVLRFDERKKGEIAGDNSSWKFPQILGSIPFGVGKTTLAEAQAKGVKSGRKKDGFETTLSWGNRNWNLSMQFTGEKPDSRLKYMEMVMKGAYGKTPSAVHDALMSHGYVYYSMGQGKAKKDLYVTVRLAQALERANMNRRSLAAVLASHQDEIVAQAFPGKGVWTVTMTLAPDLVKAQ